MFTTTQPSFARTFVATLGTAIFAGVCLFGAAAPAVAETAGLRAATIAYSDLNLASNAGRKQLDNRIAFAARQVCSTDDRQLVQRQAEKQCISAVKADARARVYQTTASADGN
jgi:UrcA family protein